MIEYISNEISLLSLINHPNLILYYGCYKDIESSIGIVTECCKGGDLYNLIHKKKVKLNIMQKLKILSDVASGMLYLHEKMVPPIIHRNLKSSNIVLTEDVINFDKIPVVKIADFGMSRLVDDSKTLQSIGTGIASLIWTAPEILKNEYYGLSADVYSFGILMWEIFSEKIPYSYLNLNQLELSIKLINNNLRPEMNFLLEETPMEIKKLINSCLNSYDNRPSFEVIGYVLREIY
jgi:serine/threonine protein kinase